MANFRDQLRNAIARRAELTLLHSQATFQVYPSPWVLADLLLRDAVLGVSRGLPGFHPAQTLADRISLRFEVEGAASGGVDLAEDAAAWALLCKVLVASDAPAVQELSPDEVMVALNRVVFLAELPVDVAREIGERFEISRSRYAKAGASSVAVEDGAFSVAPVARLDIVDGPGDDGVSHVGLSGCPVRLRVTSGETPSITVVLGFPWDRMPLGVGGGRGVLLEDVRGLGGLEDFLGMNLIANQVRIALQRIDAGASGQGEEEIGFRQRVSRAWDEGPLGPSDLLDAITDALPNLAIQYVAAGDAGEEAQAMVLEQAIVDLVGRQKTRPALLRGLVELALQKRLAPHVDQKTGEVYWLPIGQFPGTLPAEALDSKVLPELAKDL